MSNSKSIFHLFVYLFNLYVTKNDLFYDKIKLYLYSKVFFFSFPFFGQTIVWLIWTSNVVQVANHFFITVASGPACPHLD